MARWANLWKSRGAVRLLVLINVLLFAGVFAVEEWSGRLSVASREGRAAAGIAYGYSWAAMFILLGSLAWTYARFLPPFGRYLLDHLGQTAVFLLLLLVVWGLVGAGLGIPNLIWDEEPLGRTCSALGAALLLGLLGVNAYYLGITSDPREGRRLVRDMNRFLELNGSSIEIAPWLDPVPQDARKPRPDETNRQRLSIFLRFSRLPFFVLVSLPALFPVLFDFVPWSAPEVHMPWVDVSGNVRAEALAHLWSASVWGAGLAIGSVVVKLLLRFNGTINNFLAWAKGRGDRAPRVAKWAQHAALGGFLQYLMVVVVVYAYLGFCTAEHLIANVAAGLLLFAICASQLVITWILRTNRKATAADVKASVALVALILILGLPVLISDGPISPAFSIFALMGVLAISLVVSERREVRPVYLIAGAVFVSLIGIVAARAWLREPVTSQDMLALAALTPIILLEVAGRSGRTTVVTRWVAAVAAFLTMLVLARVAGPLSEASIALAAAVCLLGCWATGPRWVAPAAADAERRRWVLLTSALVFWILLVNYDPFKDRFRELAYVRQGDDHAPRGERLSSKIDAVYPYNVQKSKSYGLLENREVLRNWRGRVARYWQARPACERPKLVVMCVSGGAIRSAYWAATVLERLASSPDGEEGGSPSAEAGEFYDHVRLITGASGGMVGMSHFVAGLNRDGASTPDRPKAFSVEAAGIPPKSLREVAGFIALQAPWRMMLPRVPGDGAFDRGMVLDQTWGKLTGVSFEDLHALEGRGAIPSIVFSPMIVDDGRRLLISNLDLSSHMLPDRILEDEDELRRMARRLREWAVPVARQNDLDNDNDGRSRNKFSVSALELFKMVPDAGRLTLATAARMSATFPFVSPAVNLPTDPPLRIVDAGYYDNYGVHLAAAWILQNREWLKEHTSGVLVVQTRDAVSKRERVGIPSESPGFFDRFFRGAELFRSVSQALLQARSSTNAFRNDQEFVAVNEVFRRMGADRGFVATAVFENTAYLSTGAGEGEDRVSWPGLDEKGGAQGVGGEVPMSWYITKSEMRAIDRAFPRRPKDADLAAILANFGKHRDDFLGEKRNLKPLCKALNFATLARKGRMAPDPEKYDLKAALGLYDALIDVVDSRPGDFDSKVPYPRVAAIRAIELPDGLRAEDVLVYAHSEWLNDRAGFEPHEDAAGARAAGSAAEQAAEVRKYYTREFERAMNYHRWQAVWRWWFKDHSAPLGAPAG